MKTRLARALMSLILPCLTACATGSHNFNPLLVLTAPPLRRATSAGLRRITFGHTYLTRDSFFAAGGEPPDTKRSEKP
jgi:hypothetical protein